MAAHLLRSYNTPLRALAPRHPALPPAYPALRTLC